MSEIVKNTNHNIPDPIQIDISLNSAPFLTAAVSFQALRYSTCAVDSDNIGKFT